MSGYAQYLADLDSISSVCDVSKLAGKSVFVTGACGLIGSCLAEALLRLSDENGLDLDVFLGARDMRSVERRFAWWRGRYIPVSYDATEDRLPMGRFDFVFHCASNAHPAAYAAEPVETAMATVLGTYNLLNKLASDGGGRMVYVSSSEVYGSRKSADLYRECDSYPVDSLNPRACYPVAKRMAENLCASFKDEYGVDFVIARPGHIFGPTATDKDSRAHAQFARAAATGEPIVLKSAGTQFRSYCYVVDCVSALIFMALEGRSGEAYNISNPDSDTTIRGLAEAFAEVAGVELYCEAATDEEARGYNLMDNSALDSTKLHELGWKGQFDLNTGVARTIRSLKAWAE